MTKTLDKSELQKRYDREFDCLMGNIEKIESELALLRGRLARIELLDDMIQECD